MNFIDLYPGDLAAMEPERIAREGMRLFLVRTNLVVGHRFAMGWRGVAQTGEAGWTARIRNYPGVFGLQYHRQAVSGDWRGGVFHLMYFPSAEEDLLENISLAAAALAHRKDYQAIVRDFTAYPELLDLFVIGRVHLMVHPASGSVSLGLRARTRDRILARDGVYVPDGMAKLCLVAPGAADRDFPAFEVACAFFEILAASVTFNLQAPPSHLAEAARPGTERIYDRHGTVSSRSTEDCRESTLWLGYGIKAAGGSAIWPPGQSPDDEKIKSVPAAGSPRFPNALWRVAHRTKDIKSIDKQALGIDTRPALIVLTGFLGSGKTSFLRNFIEYQVQMNRFVAVIQNEIGTVGLDGKLMEDDVTVTEMDEGCVCCSLIGNLKSAIAGILSAFQPDYIVLETTGLANPFNLLGDLEELSEKVRFDSVTTVVDAAGAAATLDEYAVARDQVRAADILLVNKIDLVSKPTLGHLRDCLATLNPRAALVTATQGNIPPGLLYGTDPLEEVENFSAKRSRAVPATPRPTHRQEGVQSLKIAFAAPLDRDTFLRFMKEKVPPAILRIKGIIEFKDDSGPCVFQYVSGRYELSPFTNPSVPDRFLVFIGTGLDPKSIHTALGGGANAHPHA